jgi:hypothetical protein
MPKKPHSIGTTARHFHWSGRITANRSSAAAWQSRIEPLDPRSMANRYEINSRSMALPPFFAVRHACRYDFLPAMLSAFLSAMLRPMKAEFESNSSMRSSESSTLGTASLSRIVQVAMMFLLFFALTQTATAYKRRAWPVSVAAVQADAIVVARITKVPLGAKQASDPVAEIEISEVLKGKLQKGELNILNNRDLFYEPVGPLEMAAQYLLFLRPSRQDPSKQEIMLDGTQRYTGEAVATVKSLLVATPPWSDPQEGVATILVPEKNRIKTDDDLTLFFGCRNQSDKNVVLRYSDWPLETHTRWELGITSPDGKKIAPLKHPTLTQQMIVDYFSKFPRAYEVKLEPGQEHFFVLSRVNSAQPGMGHKEELDFRFYPMAQPGAYEITASGFHLFGTTPLLSKPLRIWVE